MDKLYHRTAFTWGCLARCLGLRWLSRAPGFQMDDALDFPCASETLHSTSRSVRMAHKGPHALVLFLSFQNPIQYVWVRRQ